MIVDEPRLNEATLSRGGAFNAQNSLLIYSHKLKISNITELNLVHEYYLKFY
jgi:hypothetical protein